MDVYVEAGSKRVFAGAIEWPGWCRAARSEDAALLAVIEYGPRYAAAIEGSRARVRVPRSVSALHVVERLAGDSTTDFGAPSIAPVADGRDVGSADLTRLREILRACWAAFDRAVRAGEGRELTTGPRGGGRDLSGIVTHVTEAEASYMARLGVPRPRVGEVDPRDAVAQLRVALLDALSRAVKDGQPERGPRGGVIWHPRYLVRRTAWHALDHAWEIEDRAGLEPAAR